MSRHPLDIQTWAAGILFLGLAALVGYSLPRGDLSNRADVAAPQSIPAPQAAPSHPPSIAKNAGASDRKPDATAKPELAAFSPPGREAIADDEFGKTVQLGADIFHETGKNASAFVGNSLNCVNCHLDDGRLAGSAPLWAAYVAYPAYRAKNGHVNTFAERLQGCFRFSMNGKAPPLGDKVLVALESYAYFLAKGAATGVDLPGRGYPKMSKPAKLDHDSGKAIYAEKCALCHGPDGQGQSTADGRVMFPPLWGPQSYNWGAGMSSITNAAAFIKANMPFSQGNSLSDTDAWNVAAFVDGQERPQDPRYTGSVQETRKQHHDSPMDLYGQNVNGVVLGEHSPPSGPQAPR